VKGTFPANLSHLTQRPLQDILKFDPGEDASDPLEKDVLEADTHLRQSTPEAQRDCYDNDKTNNNASHETVPNSTQLRVPLKCNEVDESQPQDAPQRLWSVKGNGHNSNDKTSSGLCYFVAWTFRAAFCAI